MFLLLFIPPSGQHAINARTSLTATDQVSHVQAVRIKGIQNKILISQQCIYYAHLWVTPLQRETIEVFF
jgi:hypothetical protein